MEPVFTVAKGYGEPPVVPPPPGKMEEGHQQQGRRGCGARRVVVGLLVFLGVTAVYAFDIYRARHSRLDLAIAIASYFLFVVLFCCVVKLRQLQLRGGDRPDAATAAQMRRVRAGAGVVTMALGVLTTWRIVDAVHGLALKLVVVAIAVVLHFVGLYVIVLRKRATERGSAEEAPQTALRGGLSSPEEKV